MTTTKRVSSGCIAAFIGLVTGFDVAEAVTIHEVMYDPSGTDSKHEWIELFNDGDSVDLGTYKLFEGGVNHKLTSVAGSTTVGAGEYAIIADDATTFLVDHPDFPGSVFDSVFSLSNAGERIDITASDGSVIDSVTYDPSIGGAGTGNSLQRLADGTFVPGAPTPGAANVSQAANESEDDDDSSTATTSPSAAPSSHSSQATTTNYAPSTKFSLGIGRARLVLAGVALKFDGVIPAAFRKPRVTWSFGDATVGRGVSPDHIYEKPGTYVVVASARTDTDYAVARTTVTVVKPEIEIVFGESIQLQNNSPYEANIGGWGVVVKGESDSVNLDIPKDTILLPGASLAVPGLSVSCDEVILDYPSGDQYDRVKCEKTASTASTTLD